MLRPRTRAALDAVRERGAHLFHALHAQFDGHPHVGDIRGRGLFAGIELVADRKTKQPFEPKARLHAQVKAAAMREGLLCYPMGGTIDGVRGDHILLAPPYIVRDTDIDQIVQRLARALESAVAAVRS